MAKKTLSRPAAKNTAKKPAAKKSVAKPTINKDESIRIEKIDNGYLAVKEIFDPKKGYHTTKVFMEKNPLEGM